MLENDSSGSAIWHIAIFEYVVLAVLRSLAGAEDGTVGVACLDLRIGRNACGFLVPLPSAVRLQVDDIGFLEIICGCSFDPVSFLVTSHRSSEVD